MVLEAAKDVLLDGQVLWTKGERRETDDPDEIAKLRSQGFVDAGTIEPGVREAVDSVFREGLDFSDPTGQHSTPVYVAKAAVQGAASSLAHGVAGLEKGAVGGVLDLASAGARVLGNGAAADQLQEAKRFNEQIFDAAALDDLILGDAFDNSREAWEKVMGVSEGLGHIAGGVAAAKPLAAGLKAAKVAKTAEGAMKAAFTAQMAAGGEEAARTQALTKKDERGNPVVDENGQPVIENRDLTWRERAEVGYHTLKEGITAQFFGRIVGAWGGKIGNAGAAALEFGGINAAGVLADAYIGDNIAGREWRETDDQGNSRLMTGNEKDMAVLQKMGAEFLYGGMQSLLMSMGGAIAGTEKRLAENRRKAVKDAMERPKVVAVGANGERVLEGGALVRVAEDGTPEVVTPYGVVLDAEGKVKTVTAGNVGETGEGAYGTDVKVRVDPLTGRPTAARETVRNALIALQEGVTIDQLRESDGWTPENKAVFETVARLKQGLAEGMPAGELVDALAGLGIGERDARAFGFIPEGNRYVGDALAVANNGTRSLQNAVGNGGPGHIPLDIAAEVARSVNAGTTGLMPKELAKRQLETARQLMAERARAELEQSAAEHGNTPEAERPVLHAPVEKADGSLATLSQMEEVERLKPSNLQPSNLQPSNPPGTTTTLRARHEREQSVRALGLRPLGDGAYGVGRFPQMRVEKADGVADDTGMPVKALRVTGLDPAEMLRPENIMDAARVLGDLMEKCAAKGVRVDFEPEAQGAVAELMARWETDVRTDPALRARAEVVTSLLEKSGLASGIVTDQAGFEAALREKGGDRAERLIADGQTYGFVDPASGTVYLNPAFFGTKQGLNTPIHEFGHLGIIACRKINRPLYDRGIDLIKQTKYWKEVVEHPDYKNYSPEKNAEEALTRLIADRGEKLSAETPKGVLNEIKQWLVDFWKTFGNALGLREITPEQVEKMTVEQIADAIRAEMLRGERFGTTRRQVEARQQAGRRLRVRAGRRSPAAYVEAGGGKASAAFLFWAENGRRIMNVPKPGEFGWDLYNQLVLGQKDPAGRARMKRLLCGDQPKNTRRKGNDEILAEFNRDFGGEGDVYTLESGFQRMVEEFLSSHADYERWRAEGAKTIEERHEEAEAERRGSRSPDVEGLKPVGEHGKGSFDPAELEEWGRMYDELHLEMAEAGLDEPGSSLHDAAFSRGGVRRKRAGTIVQRVPRSERRAFHGEFNKAMADYAHNNNGETPKTCGVFTSEAYYVFDIIGGEPLNIHRIKADGRNRKKIEELDKKYKAEIYKGTRDSAYWFDRIGHELSEHFQAGNGDQDRGAGARSGNLDLRASESAQRRVSDSNGDNAPGEREAVVAGAGSGSDIRYSIGGIYTGSAADYANRSRQGGVDDGPSVKKIGTGEGSQVYGWGLYGSTERGVAERYARANRDYMREITFRGKTAEQYEQRSAENLALNWVSRYGSPENVVREVIETWEGELPPNVAKAADILRNHKSEFGIKKPGNIYEQTFFTNRAPGDESHLLKWYEPVGKETWDVIRETERNNGTLFNDRGQMLGLDQGYVLEQDGKPVYPANVTGATLYNDLAIRLGSPQAASEFLYRAGIDGVKYPVDSYGGKGVKDGDVAGWNYVAFSDEHIRVDHKWTDGQLRFSRGLSPKDVEKEIEASGLERSAKKQMRQIVRAYSDRKGNFKEGYGKVPGDPNRPSNLGAFQWQQVRTEHFRDRFFGDWLAVKRRQLLDGAQSVPMDRSVGIAYDPSRRQEIKRKLVDWAKRTGFGGKYETEVGTVEIDFHTVKTSFGHPRWTEGKLHAIYTLEKGFRNAVYLGSLDDQVHGNMVNHYFAYKVDDGGTPNIVFCRAQEDVNKNRLYLHEIYTEAEISKSGTVKPGAVRNLLTDSAAFGKSILDPLYAVKPESVSKVVDENGEPLVVYRGSPYDPLAQEAGKGVIKPEAYFTADPEYARRYTGNGGKVGAYYLNIRRPFDIRDPECLKDLQSIYPDHEFARGKSGALDWGEASIVDGEFLKENFGDKYDGIIYDEGGDPGAKGVSYRGISYVPLDGGVQVKSATDNTGAFDPGNPDIRFSRARGRSQNGNAMPSADEQRRIEKFDREHPSQFGTQRIWLTKAEFGRIKHQLPTELRGKDANGDERDLFPAFIHELDPATGASRTTVYACEHQGDEMVKPYAFKVLGNGATEAEQYDAYREIRERFSDGAGGEERAGGLRGGGVVVSSRESVGYDVDDRRADEVRGGRAAGSDVGIDAGDGRTRDGRIDQDGSTDQGRTGSEENEAVGLRLRLSRGGYKPGDWRKTFTFGKAARGEAERTNGGLAAGEERRRWEENPVDERIPEWDAPARNPNVAKPFALSSAEGVRLVKLLGGTMKKPKAYKDAIGVIDESDERRIRDDLKAMGFFKGDDYLWAATSDPATVAADRADSQAALDARLEKLGEQRLKGEAGGGNRGLVRVSMSQVADLVLSLPAETGGNLGNVRTLAQGIVRGFEKERTPEQAAYFLQEAQGLLDWFYGHGVNAGPQPGGRPEGAPLQARDARKMLARAFGAFLEAPDAVAERAPGLYREFVDAISRNDKLLHAFDAIRRTALGEGSAERVYAEIEAGRTARAEEAARRLADEVEKPIGSRLERAKDSFVYNFDDMHGPIFMHITRAQKRQLAELKASLKAGRITQADYDAATAAFRQAVQGLKIAELKVDRGTQNEIRQYLWDMSFVFEQAKAAGVDPKDAQRYMDLRWIVSTGGRAGARGMSARDAQIVLDNMKRNMGDEAFARLEGVSAQFHAVREKNILDDPRLAAMIGQDRVDYFKNNVHYVRTERTRATPEELAKMEADRAAFRRENKGDDDVTAAMLALIEKTGGRGGGIGNSTWGHALEGSVKDVKDRLAATWRNDTRLMAAMERNDFVIKMRDALLAAKAEGVHDLPGSRSVDYPQNARYGHIRYFEGGRQRVLVVPRVLADGYRQVGDAMTGWSAWGKIAHGVFIDWNLAYTLRNMTRNMASNEANIVGMRADNATILGNAIAPGVGHAASMAAYQLARHLPERVFRNPFARAVWGGHVNAAYARQAQRILELYLDPRRAVERRAAAEEARLRGVTGPAMELDADLELMRFMTKSGALIARWDEVQGAGRDADLFMQGRGLGPIYGEAGAQSRSAGGKALDAATWIFRRNAQFNRDLELHAKITAALAIHEMQPGLTAEQVGIEVARRASNPQSERRGASSKMINYAWNMFYNTALKGGQRFVGNVVRNPRLAGKMAAQSLGPQLFWATMIAGGGLAAVIRNMFGGGDDAEEKARQAGLGWLLDYTQFMHDGSFAASPYLQRFYHWCPLGKVGERYIGIALTRTDEEKTLLPFIDWLAARLAPQPTDPTATLGDAVKRSVVGTFVPDLTARTPLVAAAQDLVFAWWQNPMDTYRGTHVYDNSLWQARGESLADAAAFAWATAKQGFNDLGGRTIVRPRRNEIEVAEGSGAQPPSFAEEAWDFALNDIPVLSGVLGGTLRMTLTKEQRLDQVEREALAPIRAVKNRRSEEIMKMMLESPVANNGSETPEIKERLDAWAKKYGWDKDERGNVFARAFNGYQAATDAGKELAAQRKEANRQKRWAARPASERRAMEAAGLREIQAQ